jgi:hypothetical protein
MRIVCALVAVSMLSSPAVSAHVKRLSSIPDVLQGSWTPAAGNCEAADKPAVVLSAKSYASAETKCAVGWVSETPSPRGPVYSAYLRCSGSAAKEPTASNLIIRPEGANKISIGPSFSDLKAYQRCAGKQ